MGAGAQGVLPAFEPSDLSVPTYNYDIQDLTTLIVERSGGTTQATVGGPVGRIIEKRRTGYDAVAPTDAKRAILRLAPTGRYYLETDGTDDCYQVANIPLSNRFSVYVGFKDDVLSKQIFIEHSANANANAGFFLNGTSPGAWAVNRNSVLHNATGQVNWAGTDLGVARLTYQSSNQQYHRNGLEMLAGSINGTQQAESSATTTLNLFSRNSASVFSDINAFSIVIANGELSTADVTRLSRYVAGKTCRYIYVAEGDSITASPGLPDSYARRWWASFVSTRPLDAAWCMSAVGGSRQSDLRARAPLLDDFVSTGNTTAILSVLIGAGSSDLIDYIGILGNGLDGWLADLAAYCDARRSAGFKVIASTLHPKASVTGWETARSYVNPIIRTWVGSHCEAVADYAAHPIMGPAAAASDVTLYSDGTHPTALGQTYNLDVFTPVINSML